MISSTYRKYFVKGYAAFATDNDFKAKAADTFYDLSDYFTTKYENLGENFLVDAQDDSLALRLKGHEILCSRQAPSHQIWVSSPASGSLKFEYDTDLDAWVDHKDSSLEINKSLEKEIELTMKID